MNFPAQKKKLFFVANEEKFQSRIHLKLFACTFILHVLNSFAG